MADQTDRDAVAATLAAHRWNASEDFTYLWCVCGWRGDVSQAGVILHLAEVLAPLLAQVRAEGARDALNTAADVQDEDHAIEVALGGWAYAAAWLRERAAQHEEQP